MTPPQNEPRTAEDWVKGIHNLVMHDCRCVGDYIPLVNRIINTTRTQALAEGEIVLMALKPFGSGVDPIPWGKIKAYLPTDLAKLLTRYNVAADNAILTAAARMKGEGK